MSLVKNSCCGLLVVAMMASVTYGEPNAFIVRAGLQDTVPPSGPVTMSVSPGETVALEVWLAEGAPQLLAGYQVSIEGVATPGAGAAGIIEYLDTAGNGGSVLIDITRPDWALTGVPGISVIYAESFLPTEFSLVAFQPILGLGSAVDLGYIGEFQFTVSADACGAHTVDFQPLGTPPSGGTLFSDETGMGQVAATLRQLILDAGPCTEACCFAGGGCNNVPAFLCNLQGGISQGEGTSCENTPCTAPEACCFGNGDCDDLDSSDCTAQGGTPQGSATTCAADGCPSAPVIVHATGQPGETQPCSGYTDPKRESSNGNDLDFGLTELTLVFSMPVFSIGGGALGPADFEVHETGIAFVVDGSQPVPPTASGSHGLGNVSLNAAETELTIHIEHDLASVSVGHIHRAAAGANGGIAFPFASAASPIDALWALNPADVADLMAGNLYVNLHSPAFPGGEIRGQILPNAVASVDATGNPTVLVTLERPISLQEWTTTQAVVQNAGGVHITNLGDLGSANEPDRHDSGFMPCDVDQSGSCSPFDLLRFRQFVNQVSTPDCGVLLDFLDIDRTGTTGPFDLLAFRQLVNGVFPATQPWGNTPMNNPRP